MHPYPEYTEGGVKWFPRLPRHWSVSKRKFLCRFTSGGTPPSERTEYWGGDIPWISPKDMKTELLGDSQDKITTEAITRGYAPIIPSGAILIVTRSGILRHTIPVSVATSNVSINQDIKALTPRSESVNCHYIAHVVRGHQNFLLSVWRKQGATVESLETDIIADTYFPVPPRHEQDAIVSFVASQTRKIKSLHDRLGVQVPLLLEWRTALIVAAVMGKMDLRGYAVAGAAE